MTYDDINDENIIEAIKFECEKQGSKFDRYVSVYADNTSNGFNWDISVYGPVFWSTILGDKNFNYFYESKNKNNNTDFLYFLNKKDLFLDEKNKCQFYSYNLKGKKINVKIEILDE